MAASSKVNGEQHITKALSILDQVNQEIQSDRMDQAHWWKAFGPSLATLLQTCQYSDDEQLYYLRWFHQWIAPSLGPRPIDGKPHYGAWLTYDWSPLEYSINWKEKQPNQTVRFAIEPASPKAGTAADRLNQRSAKDWLTKMAKDVPGVDLTRFDLFLSETNVPDEAADEVLSKMPPTYLRTRVWVAFDLERGRMVAKAYFVPLMKAIYTGSSPNTIVFDAIRKCNGLVGSYNASIAVVNSYFESFADGRAPLILSMATDCVADSPESRVKIYVDASIDTLAKAKDMFHLGGRLSGPAIAVGLKAVGDFWCHLFGLDSSDPEVDEKVVLTDGEKCLFVFELMPTPEGQEVSDMVVKMHIPAWRIGKTDEQIGGLLSTWFQSHGHDDFATRYQSDLASSL